MDNFVFPEVDTNSVVEYYPEGTAQVIEFTHACTVFEPGTYELYDLLYGALGKNIRMGDDVVFGVLNPENDVSYVWFMEGVAYYGTDVVVMDSGHSLLSVG